MKQAFRIAAAALLCLGASLALPALAQTYPNKPIVLISPWPPGGGADAVARPIFHQLSENLGQQIVIDSKPGAGGEIGTAVAARAAPDGYTLLLAQFGPNVLSHALQRKTQYDTLRDFRAVSQLVTGINVLVVRGSLPVNSLRELIDYAKANPGKLNYASAGPGSHPQLAAEMLKSKAGVSIEEIAYKGSAQYVLDIAAGRLDMGFISYGSVRPHIVAGTMRALAVSTLKRSNLLPDVPAIAEILPGFEYNTWYGVMVPVNTPDDIVRRLSGEIRKVVQSSDVSARLRAIGQEPEGTSPEQFEAKIRADIAFWTKEAKTILGEAKN